MKMFLLLISGPIYHYLFVSLYFSQEIDRGTLIKDIMRDHSIRDIAKFWITLLDMSDKVSPAVIRLCLDVIGSYVAWIDISLITNDCLMSKLFALFTLDDFRCSVCDCFAGVLRKGMDPLAKTSLIEQFLAVDAIKQKLHAIINCNSEDDQEFLIKLSRLMNTIGLELILSFKKVKSKVSIQPTLEVSLKVLANAIDDKFPLLCYFLGHQKHIVCYQIHPFAREYIQWIKSNRILSSSSSTSTSTVSSSCTSNSKQVEIPLIETISPDRVKEIISIFTRIIVSTCKYNETIYTSQLCDDLAFDEFRKSCKVIFENLIGLNHTYCCNIVCSTLIQNELTKIPSTIEPFDIEVSLYMFYLLGENINLITSVREIESILSLIITSNISSLAFPPVQILYFEIVNRYEKLYATSLINYIPQILVSFVDERGLKSKDTFVRSKVCSLFNKFIKNTLRGKAVGKINEFSEEIITRLQEFLTLDVSNILSHHQTTDVRLNEEDQLLLYETVSCLIISNVSYDPVKKHMLLKSFLLSPLWTDYDHLYSSLVSRLPATTNGSHYVQVKNAFSNTTGATSASNGTNNSFSDPIIDAICLRVAHSINLVARISKAFSNVHTLQSIQGQGLFLDSFNTFSKVLSLSSIGDDNLIVIQSALRQLLHRLVVCLEEAEILPLLPIAIEKVFLTFSGAYFTEKSVQELIPLLSQVVTKFKNSWMFQRDLLPFLKQMVTPLLSSLYTLINDANELYDDKKQALQKSYYAFLSVLAVNNAIEVLTVLGMLIHFPLLILIILIIVFFLDFSDPLAFQSVTDTVVKGTVNSDVATQKICFSILRKLIECQCKYFVVTCDEVYSFYSCFFHLSLQAQSAVKVTKINGYLCLAYHLLTLCIKISYLLAFMG